MMEDKERIGSCETCGCTLWGGDPVAWTVEGCVLCEAHAPMLSDALRQHLDILADDPCDPGELNCETREEVET